MASEPGRAEIFFLEGQIHKNGKSLKYVKRFSELYKALLMVLGAEFHHESDFNSLEFLSLLLQTGAVRSKVVSETSSNFVIRFWVISIL